MSTEFNPPLTIREGAIKYWDHGDAPNIHHLSGQKLVNGQIKVVCLDCGCSHLYHESDACGIPVPDGHTACTKFPNCGWPERAVRKVAQFVIDEAAFTPGVDGNPLTEGGDSANASDTDVCILDSP